MIKVAIGVIKKSNKYLCVQRKAEKQLAYKWEFPGGKFEYNETPTQALIRELKEELAVDITNISLINNYQYDYGFGKYDLYFFKCDIIDDSNIILSEHIQYGWFTLNEIDNIDFVLSSKEVLKNL